MGVNAEKGNEASKQMKSNDGQVHDGVCTVGKFG